MNEECTREHVATTDEEHDGADTQESIAHELEQFRQESLQWKDRFVRMKADFDNYKRRTEKEQALWMRSSKVVVLRNLLPVIDTVELALLDCAKREHTAENESLISGIKMMGAGFHKFLEVSEVSEIKEGTVFDPLLHEAIVQVETDKCQSGDVVEVLQKGYLFGDQVMRPAKVSVAK